MEDDADLRMIALLLTCWMLELSERMLLFFIQQSPLCLGAHCDIMSLQSISTWRALGPTLRGGRSQGGWG